MTKRSNYDPKLYQSPTYKAWSGMKQRCSCKDRKDYYLYGGRGIKVCARWQKFDVFLLDMGIKPQGHQLDRINNNGNYEPKNCRWATPKQNANNRRSNCLITYKGKTQTIQAWADELDIGRGCLRDRLNRYKWSVERALSEPTQKHKPYKNRRGQ